MLNSIWIGIFVSSILFGAFNGTLPQIEEALLESGGEAVSFAMGILGATALWTGMMSVLEGAGGIRLLSKIIRGPIRKLIPSCKNNLCAEKQVVKNLTANFLGLGNGATPSGVAAVRELQSDGRSLSDIGMFIVMNSAALELLPTSVISVLAAAGSKQPTKIIIPVWISSLLAIISGTLLYLVFRRRKK